MSFLTVLQKVGHDIAAVFEKAEPIVNEIQAVVTPIENVFAPGLGNLINAGVSAIEMTEGLAAAAGKQNGSGGTKAAFVISTLATNLGPTLIALGVDPTKVTTTQYQAFINGIVQAANAFITTTTVPTSGIPANPTGTFMSAAPVTGAVVAGK